MNPLTHSKNTTILPLLIPLVFVCFGLLPRAQAVLPAPDGGYPGQNTAEGQSALLHLAGGTYNTALGWASLGFNVTGNYNTGVGAATLLNNTASENTATGAGALLSNTVGYHNTANGAFALFSNTTGHSNTANGYKALDSNTTGKLNTANGRLALGNNRTGDYNTALGEGAGYNITGSNNICIGVFTPGQAGVNSTTWIGNVFSTVATTRQVYVNSDDKIGTLSSSRRYKEDIKSMDTASETLFALKPVTFRYKKEIDPSRALSFGLVAEEVANISPDLITRDEEGQPQTVRYEAINAMLLNEFLKEHRTVQEQKAIVEQLKQDFQSRLAQQQKQIEALTAGLQKVSTRLEASKPESRLANH